MKTWRKSKAARMLLIAYIKINVLVFVCSFVATMLYQIIRNVVK